MKALLFGADEAVAQALYVKHNWPFFKYDRAVGILNEEQLLVGVALFQSWNGANVDFSYYGNGTLTMGLIRELARFAIREFDCSRVTVLVSKKRKRYLKTVLKFGFSYEGTQRCQFGKLDNMRNTAVRFVMFREQLEKLGRLNQEKPNAVDAAASRTNG